MDAGSTTAISTLQSAVETAAGQLGRFVAAVAPEILAVSIALVAIGLAIRLIRKAG